MKKKIIYVFCVCSMLFIVIALVKGKKYVDIYNLYDLTKRGDDYEININNMEGDMIFCQNYKSEPVVKIIYDDTFLLIRGKGDWHTYTFINVKTSSVSKEFDDISTWNSKKVAYAVYEEGGIKVIVQDIYDEKEYYMEIIRDYATSAVPHYVIEEAEFLNDSQLVLKYYNKNYEIKQETIDL